MGKEILTFGDIELAKKKEFYYNTSPVPLRTHIEKILVSKKISSGEKTINTLLVTCLMITKLNHYI